MAGGLYPSKMSINKNKYIEEWNGLREITETNFVVDSKIIRQWLLWGLFIPYSFYWIAKDDLENRYKTTGDVRYKEMI